MMWPMRCCGILGKSRLTIHTTGKPPNMAINLFVMSIVCVMDKASKLSANIQNVFHITTPFAVKMHEPVKICIRPSRQTTYRPSP